MYWQLGRYFELDDGFDEIPAGSHRPFQYQLSTILKLSWKKKTLLARCCVLFSRLFLWTHRDSLTNALWLKDLNLKLLFHSSRKWNAEGGNPAPTCNGRASIQRIVTVLVSSWDGNHSRPILKGRSIGSWCDFQQELSNEIAECYNSLFSRW